MTAMPSLPPSSAFCIVVGLDFTDAGGFAFREASFIARRIPRSQVHLIHVFEHAPSDEEARALTGRLRTYADEQAAAVGGLGETTIGVHLRAGSPAVEIRRFAREVGADLIMLGAQKGPHLKSWAVGSVAEHVLEAASCPVVVAGPKPREVPRDAATVEPLCPDCSETRTLTHGGTWWCARHSEHARAAHAFSYLRELPLSTPDTLVTPDGIGT